MESELERFHKQNTQLELNITELRQKLKATEKEMHGERQRVRDVEAVVRRFKTDLHNCVGYIQDPKLLKESIRALYQKHVQEDIVSSTSGQLHDCATFNTRQLITVRNEVANVLHVSVCPRGGGLPGQVHPPPKQGTPLSGSRYTPQDQVHPPGTRYTPPRYTPRDQVHASGTRYSPPPPRDGYCCRRYASYWNAFLFFIVHHCEKKNISFWCFL